MSLPIRLCCSNNQGRRCRSLYIICVIVARILGDYLLANLIEYLYDFTYLSLAKASAIVNAKEGVAGICGVIGAILMDVYLTNYGMIFFSSLIYGLGLVCIIWGFLKGTVGVAQVAVGTFMAGAVNLSLMNSSDTLAKEQTDTKFLSNIIKFLFENDADTSKRVQEHRTVILLFFIKYAAKVMFIIASLVLGRIFVDPDPRDYYKDKQDVIYYNNKYNYTAIDDEVYEYRVDVIGAQFLLPTSALLLMALISLAKVKKFVKKVEDRGTHLKRVVYVCMTAFRKRRLHCPQNPQVGILHEGNPEHPLAHSNSLRFLDKAAVIDPSQPVEQQGICSVTEVEETKCLLRMVPMCMTFLLYGMVKSVGNTFFLIQGNEMDGKIRTINIEVPIQTLIIIGEISGLVTKGLYFILISKRLTGTGKKYGSPIKYAIGIVLATFCCTVASWTAADKGVSLFLLTPQFLLFGAMSEVTHDGIRGFFNDQLPPSIKRYDSVFTDAITGTGAILCTALVYATHSSIEKCLDKFYRLLTVACFIILSAYTFVASRYRYQDNMEVQSNPDIQG